MATKSDNGAFTFTWRIENFSMCPLKKCHPLTSPSFEVDGLDKTTWQLLLYPKGLTVTDDYISCYAYRAVKKDEPDKVTACLFLKIISLQTESYIKSVKKLILEKGKGYGFQNFISHINLKEKKNSYLPNDVLTIVCCIQWGTETVKISSPVNRTYAQEEIYTLISGDKLKTQYRLQGLTYTTRIIVKRSEIKWIIKDFKTQMQTVRKIPVSVLTKLRKKSTLLLYCYLSSDWASESSVRIDIQKKDVLVEQIVLNCKVSVLNNKGTAHKYLEEIQILGKDYKVSSLPSLIKVRDIENPEYELLHDGALTLQFEFNISYFEENDHLLKSLRNDIGELLNDKELADVTLISEGLEIPVLKSIISARSPVFRAMFTNDTEEKRTGVVHINDIEANILKNLINFMYGNDLPDLQPEDVTKLYSAADKYQFLELKNRCSDSLKYTMTVSNVCEVLMLADLHEDGGLLKYIHDFFRFNSLDVLESAEWMNLMENNIKLTADTMKKILITKTSS